MTSERAELVAGLKALSVNYRIKPDECALLRKAADILESQAVAGSIRVDIEGVGICDIPVRDGVAYMPEITVADIVRRAQPAPVDAAVARDAARYRYIIKFSNVQTAIEILLRKDTLFGPEFDEAIDAALSAQQQETKG